MLERHPKLNKRPDYFITFLNMSMNSKCNNHCNGCCGLLSDAPDMPFDKLRQILHACIHEGNVTEVYPSCYAEATLYPYLNEMVRYIDTLDRPLLNVRQDTNARIIPPGFIEAVNSVRYNYDVSISLWASNEKSYGELQGNGFDAVVDNARCYLRELKTPPSFSLPHISDLQARSTLGLIERLADEAGYGMQVVSNNAMPVFLNEYKKHGIVPVFLRNYTTYDENGEPCVKLHDGSHRKFIGGNNCDVLFKAITILPNGDIMACPGMTRNRQYVLGSVYNYDNFGWSNIVDLYRSEKAMKMLEANCTAGRHACEVCKTCTYRICN